MTRYYKDRLYKRIGGISYIQYMHFSEVLQYFYTEPRTKIGNYLTVQVDNKEEGLFYEQLIRDLIKK